MKDADQFPYLRKSLLGPWWKEAGNRCTIESVEEFELSMNKTAPPLRDQPPPPPLPKAPAKRKEPPKPAAERLVDAIIKVHDWANHPPTPKPPPAPVPPPIKKPRVKPFDIQDIPDAMERIGWTMAARVQRKWLNYANTDEGAIKGINQEGKPFPASMIDTTMFKLDWILQFPRAKKKFDELVSSMLFNERAKDSLRIIFTNRTPSLRCIDAWKLCNEGIHEYHKHFQYQRNAVVSDYTSKLAMFAKGSARPNGIWMDDLYGALGGFSFYAAIGGFIYSRQKPGLTRLKIFDVSVYMRDAFTFHDRSER